MSTTSEIRLSRRGTTLLEVIAAGAVLAVLMVVCAQMLSRAAVQQRAIANRRAALQTASNAMERVFALPWDSLDSDGAGAIAAAVAKQEMIRGGDVEVSVDEPDATLRAKRVRVTVTWNEANDEVLRKQQLIAWRYGVASRDRSGEEAKRSPLLEETQ